MKKYFSLFIAFILAQGVSAQELTPSLLLGLIKKQNNFESSEHLIISLSEKGMIPFTHGDSCLFVYLGEADSILWNGDFNAWSRNREFNNKGEEVVDDIWILKSRFPPDARLDYKIVVDGNWILDPLNPNKQWTGMGGGAPNSELRMPEWKQDVNTLFREEIPHGMIMESEVLSTHLERKVAFSLYFPHDYKGSNQYPILYFTDGHEYKDERIGNATVILDNLIQDKKILPAVGVFVDPRDLAEPGRNLRMQEYGMNDKFLKFFKDELIPKVEDSIGIRVIDKARAIIGTSLGGLNAAYFGFSEPDIFPLIGIQSPAFHHKPEIFQMMETFENKGRLKIHITTGVIHDTRDAALKAREIIDRKGYHIQYLEVNEGHSWGNWKALLDDMLIFLLSDFAKG